jgi:UDP-GlcNAc:undecaprenyl-phosphate/decaprenyl-phosphate GlcNAc-1-phosphate transferase
MIEPAPPKNKRSTAAIRIGQFLLFLVGIIWAFKQDKLDQMQWPGFLIALAISWWLTPEIRSRAMKLGLVDKPGEDRRIHKVAVPRLGGVAIYISILATLLIMICIAGRFPKELGIAGIAAGGTLIFVLGLLDDLESIPAKIKLLVQVLAGCAAYSLGVRIEKRLPLPFAIPFLHINGGIDLGPFAMAVTVAWLVGIANAVNLIDGMDGLAAGVSAIASVTIWAIAMAATEAHPNAAPYPALIAAVLAGALLGFLRWNFNPARIFLGDSGAYLAGFVLGCIAITGIVKKATVYTVGLPLLVLFFPLLDTAWAVVRRVWKRQSIFQPDAEHIHHRLLRTGMSQKNVAYVIYAISATLGLVAAIMADQAQYYLTILAAVGVMALFFAEVLNKHRQRRGPLPPEDLPPDEPPMPAPPHSQSQPSGTVD